VDGVLRVGTQRALVHEVGDPLRQRADLLEVLGCHPGLTVGADAVAGAGGQAPLHVARGRGPQGLLVVRAIQVGSRVVAVSHWRAAGAAPLARIVDDLQEPRVGELARVVARGGVGDAGSSASSAAESAAPVVNDSICSRSGSAGRT
jgi:hypothetical protein